MSIVRERRGRNVYYTFQAGARKKIYLGRADNIDPERVEEAADYLRSKAQHYANLLQKLETLVPEQVRWSWESRLIVSVPSVSDIQTKTTSQEPDLDVRMSADALNVLRRKYLRKDAMGQLAETPAKMFRRVARNIAQADLTHNPNADLRTSEEEFYEIMANLEFLPNSLTLMNAGTELQQLLYSFVLPIEDSMESIFEAIKNTAVIYKSGGRTGFSLSKIRPKNDVVFSSKGVESGPVAFMAVFDAAVETIKQGSKEGGTNIGMLRVDHPDIIDFIFATEVHGNLENFNTCVAVTNEFMQSVKDDKEYYLVNPRTNQLVERISARKVLHLIANQVLKIGQPMVAFSDRLNEHNPTPRLGTIESAGLSGEQLLLPYESCSSGAINLAVMVKDRQIDYERLARVVSTAIHFLDNVIDMNKYVSRQIEETTKGNRKIGLGVMGFADMLVQLGIPYDSEEALSVAERVMQFISSEARIASANLGKQRGTFPNFPHSVYGVPGGNQLRNATTIAVAPTGDLSIIASCSNGIEPMSAVGHIQKVADNIESLEVNPFFEKIAREREFYSEELMRRIAESESIQGIKRIPVDVRRIFVMADEIAYDWHIRIQATFQKFTDNAVSKLIKLGRNATPQDVERIYLMAYELGCKNITVCQCKTEKTQAFEIASLARDDRLTLSTGLSSVSCSGCSEDQEQEENWPVARMDNECKEKCLNNCGSSNFDSDRRKELFVTLEQSK